MILQAVGALVCFILFAAVYWAARERQLSRVQAEAVRKACADWPMWRLIGGRFYINGHSWSDTHQAPVVHITWKSGGDWSSFKVPAQAMASFEVEHSEGL